MECGGHPDLAARWKAEKRWFRRTVGFAAALTCGVTGWVGLSYLAYLKFQELQKAIIASNGAKVTSLVDELTTSPIEYLGHVLVILIPVCGLGLLVSLILWLLAIRKRRRVQVAGVLPRENR
jgi:hypothetical protein